MEQRERVLVSACLMGFHCRYDGKDNGIPEMETLSEMADLYPFCPEIYGGLPTPRDSAEILDGRVVTKSGRDVTKEYEKGAEECASFARALGVRFALLKARSPSCGSGRVYDGSFSRTLIPGDGVAAGLLKKAGVCVFREDEIELLMKALSEQNA